MATAMQTTVKVYRGVPLVKGGTDVLYRVNAEGVIGGYAIKTYSQYYYTRESENRIQVEDDISELEGANYVSFTNASHGGKTYYGFIDHLRYVSDKCTEIQFTVDPFATFSNDAVEADSAYVIRNTVKTDTRGRYTTDDFLPATSGNDWTASSVSSTLLTANKPIMYFVANTLLGTYIEAGGVASGIQIAEGTNVTIQQILTNDGQILGCYLGDTAMLSAHSFISLGTVLTVNGVSGSYRHNKINTGVYNKVLLQTTQGSKWYDFEDFANVSNIAFAAFVTMLPSPTVLIYPVNYRGILNNYGEGLRVQLPMIPVSTPAVYSQGQAIGDILGALASVAGGAIGGAAMGTIAGIGGAAAGGIMGAVGGLGNIAKNAFMTNFKTPGITASSFPTISPTYALQATLSVVRPTSDICTGIDNFFDYYGYAINYQLPKADINTDDGAYLQTGSVFLAGSEADTELNGRIMNGIKIRKTLS